MHVLIEIEFCKNCHFHTWCSRHDQIKYIDFFQQLSHRISVEFPNAKVIERQVPPQLEPKSHTSKQQNKYVNRQTGEIVIFPRSGAFEVYVDGIRIYSKIKRKMWPKFDKVIENLHRFINAKANDEDLTPFDIDYVDPSTQHIPITNADLYDIQAIFRVRKQKNQGTPVGRSIDIHSSDRSANKINFQTLNNKSTDKNVVYFQESESQQKINRVNGWKDLSNKAKNIYLREVYAKGGKITQRRKPRLRMIKDDFTGSITIENSKGQRQTYFKALERKSRENSRRKKLKPLPDSTVIGSHVDQNSLLEDERHTSEPLLINQFNSGVRPSLYRQRKLLAKKKKQEQNKSQNEIKKKSTQEDYTYEQFIEQDKSDGNKNLKQTNHIEQNKQLAKQTKSHKKQEIVENDYEEKSDEKIDLMSEEEEKERELSQKSQKLKQGEQDQKIEDDKQEKEQNPEKNNEEQAGDCNNIDQKEEQIQENQQEKKSEKFEEKQKEGINIEQKNVEDKLFDEEKFVVVEQLEGVNGQQIWNAKYLGQQFHLIKIDYAAKQTVESKEEQQDSELVWQAVYDDHKYQLRQKRQDQDELQIHESDNKAEQMEKENVNEIVQDLQVADKKDHEIQAKQQEDKVSHTVKLQNTDALEINQIIEQIPEFDYIWIAQCEQQTYNLLQQNQQQSQSLNLITPPQQTPNNQQEQNFIVWHALQINQKYSLAPQNPIFNFDHSWNTAYHEKTYTIIPTK